MASSSKYAPLYSIPDSFPEEVRFLSRELLRNWSVQGSAASDSQAWVLAFSRDYFVAGGRAAVLSGRAEATKAAHKDPTADDLRLRIAAIFREADADGNMFLDRQEFKRCMTLFADELELPVGDLRHLVATADENEDGVISYEEFVPIALELLMAMFAQKRFAAEQAARTERAVEASQTFLINGMPREDLEASLRQIFNEADTDHSGALSRTEMIAALRASDLGLTKKQIKLLVDEAGATDEAHIGYEAFVPIAFSLLTDLVAKQLEYDSLPHEEAGCADYVRDMCARYDPEGTGRVTPEALKAAIRDSDFGMSKLQLRSLLALAHVDGSGGVDYSAFAVKAAGLLAAMMRVASDSGMSARLLLERSSGAYATVAGLGRPEFTAALGGLLATLPADENGRVNLGVLQSGLIEGGAAAGLALDEDAALALVGLGIDGDYEEGAVGTAFILDYAFDTLQALAEMKALEAY